MRNPQRMEYKYAKYPTSGLFSVEKDRKLTDMNIKNIIFMDDRGDVFLARYNEKYPPGIPAIRLITKTVPVSTAPNLNISLRKDMAIPENAATAFKMY
jgi:hypothetical protein